MRPVKKGRRRRTEGGDVSEVDSNNVEWRQWVDVDSAVDGQ